MSVQLLFKLLGWKIAETGAEAKGFDTSLNCLGVTIDLRKFLSQRGVRKHTGPKGRAVESHHLSLEEWQP